MESLFKLSIFVVTILCCHGINNNVVAQNPPFQAIFQFGDSVSDTGNDVKLDPAGNCGKAPYGQTFFKKPTGRCSNGLLIVDYIAQSFKIPLINPYQQAGDFTHGANFAVAGATATSTSPSSLPNQVTWFKTFLANKCANPADCKTKLRGALFIMGEIGGNDYNGPAFGGGKKPADLASITPKVINAIRDAITQLINLGATRFLIPGNFPVGCMTIYLARYTSTDKTMYDELGCLKSWNALAKQHNDALQVAIKALQKQHPDVKMLYGDIFSAFQGIIRQAPTLGFNKAELFKGCCGAGDAVYNFGGPACGTAGATVCPNPDVRLSWDGIHPTQHAYQIIANQLIKQLGPKLI